MMHAQNQPGEELLRLIVDALYPVPPKALYSEPPGYAALDVWNVHFFAEAAVAHQHHVAFLNRPRPSPRVSDRIEALANDIIERKALSAAPTHFWEAEIDPWDGCLRARRVVFREVSSQGFNGPEWCLPCEMPTALRQEVERIYELWGDLPRQHRSDSDLISGDHPENNASIQSSFEPSARSENGSTHPTHCGAPENNGLARMRIARVKPEVGNSLRDSVSCLRAIGALLKGLGR